MAQGIRTPGPINVWVRFRNVTTAFYFGTCIEAPEPEGEDFDIEVMNDIGGRREPFQRVQDGGHDEFPLIMNRFDLAVYNAIKAIPSGVAPAVPPGGAPTLTGLALGSETGLARGTLLIGISDFQLIFGYSYAGTPAAGQFVGGIGAQDMPMFRMYLSCKASKFKETPKGTRVLDIAMSIKTNNVFQAGSTVATRGFGRYVEGGPGVVGSLAPIS